MSCDYIRSQLTDYIDESLSDDIKTAVKNHVSSCAHCSKDLEDLKKTISLVHNLKEVETPPWYTQNIMSYIKRESQEKGVLDKLKDFFTVGVQVKVFASVFMVFITIFLYRTIIYEPEHLNRGTRLPAVESEKRQGSLIDKSHTIADSVKTSPQDRQYGNKQYEQKDSGATIHKTKPEALVQEKGSSKAQGLIAEKSSGAAHQELHSAPLVEHKQEGDTIFHKDQGLVLTGATTKRSVPGKTWPVEITLNVSDLATSSTEIDSILKKLDAKITRYELLEKKELYSAELNSQNYAALIDKLKTLGDMKSKNAPAGLGEDIIIVKIEITNSR